MIKKIPFVMLFLICLSGKLLAQQELVWQLQKTNSDTTRLRIFKQLGELYQKRRHIKNLLDLDTANKYFFKALALSYLVADSSKYSTGEILMSLGEVAIGLNDIPKGRRYFMQSIARYHKKQQAEYEAKAWERLGNVLNFSTSAQLHVPLG